MCKIFEVELASEDRCTELTFPATPYALLDALEKLELKEGDCLHLVGRSTDALGRSWLEVLDWYKVTQEGENCA